MAKWAQAPLICFGAAPGIQRVDQPRSTIEFAGCDTCTRPVSDRSRRSTSPVPQRRLTRARVGDAGWTPVAVASPPRVWVQLLCSWRPAFG